MTNEEIGRFIGDLKSNRDPAETYEIPVLSDSGDLIASLRAIDRALVADHEVIACLTKWRNQAMPGFLTQFKATEQRTREWLDFVSIPDSARILFLIVNVDGRYFGNAGLCSISSESAELDNFIRGERGGDPRLMESVERSILSWMWRTLGIRTSIAHVFSNNWLPISTHKALGFETTKKYSLSTVEEESTLRHLLDSPEGQRVKYSYLKMVLNAERFARLVREPAIPEKDSLL